MNKSVIQKYIDTLRNFKKTGGSLDDAIIIAETLMIELERKQRRADFEAGGKSGFKAAGGHNFLTFEEYIDGETN